MGAVAEQTGQQWCHCSFCMRNDVLSGKSAPLAQCVRCIASLLLNSLVAAPIERELLGSLFKRGDIYRLEQN